MGMKETINAGTLSAFKAIGNLNVRMTYKSATGQIVRDLDAGTSVAVVVNYTLQYGTFVKWTDSENDRDPTTATTSKFIFPLALLAVDPKASDIMTDKRGRTWEIVKILHEPSDSLGKLQVRTTR